jgi:predicted RND superfamily exporter protein
MKRLSRLIYRYDLFILLAALLLTVLAVFGMTRITMVSNVAFMLPRDDPVVSDYLDSLERMGTLDYLVVLISSPEKKELIGFSDTFAGKLSDSKLVSEVNYTITERDKEYILHSYLPDIFLYLDDEGFKRIEQKLGPRAIEESLKIDKSLLLTPISSTTAEFVVADPLNFLSVVYDETFSAEGGFSIDTGSGYYLSVDGKHLLMLARPVKPPQDIDFDSMLFSRLHDFEREIKKDPAFRNVTVEYTGGYPIALGDASTIRGDLQRTLTIALIAVLVLFYLVFRRYSFLFFVGPCLNLGILWTLGFAGFTLGHLNMITAAFGAILAGLGIDYSIHFYNGFLGENFKGVGLEKALETTFMTTGKGIVTAALTNSIAFFSMVFTHFTGLSELGLIGGFGILLTLISNFMVLPSVIVRYMKIRGGNVKYLEVPTFGVGKLAAWVVKRRYAVLIASGVITIIAVPLIGRVGFNTDANKLRPKDNPALEVQTKIARIFSGPSPEIIVTAQGGDLDELLVISERATAILEGRREIEVVEGPGAFLPSLKKQRENIARAQELHLDTTIDVFRKTLVRDGFNEEPFEPFINSLKRFSNGQVEPVTYERISNSVAEEMVKKYLSRIGDTWYVSIFAYPKGGVWVTDIDRNMVSEIKSLSPGISVASITMVIAQLKRIISRDFTVATILALLGVLAVLIIQFRNMKGVLFCIISLGIGIVWMLGCMGLFGIPLNFANIVVIPMVIGLGIDNNTHLYHRYRENQKEGVVEAMSFTGRAVVISTMTSIAGFGSLIFARYSGLRSIGILAVIGLVLCLITAIFVLPSLIAIGQGDRQDKK